MKTLSRSTVINLVFLLIGTHHSQAAVQVGDRGDVSWNDSVNWSSAGAEFDLVPSGTSVNSAGGSATTLNLPAGSFDAIRLNQDGGWLGNFGAGEALIYTDVQDVWLEIDFASPVLAAGAELQPDYLSASTFTAQIEAFDSSDNSLGLFNVVSPINQPAFLGIQSALAEIDRIRFSVTQLVDADPADGIDPFPGFALNRLDFLKRSGPTVPDAGNLVVCAAIAWISFICLGLRKAPTSNK